MKPVAWIESFLDLNAEKVKGPPGRWRRVYREGDVRAVLEWANMHILEEQRLRDLLTERWVRMDPCWNPDQHSPTRSERIAAHTKVEGEA